MLTPVGELRPPPENGVPEIPVPVAVSAVTVDVVLFVIHAPPDASIAIAEGPLNPLPVNGLPACGAPEEVSTVTLLPVEFVTHKDPLPSTAAAEGFENPLPEYVTEIVQSLGAAESVGWNGALAAVRLYSVLTFKEGFFAIFKAAPIVSVGAVPPAGVAAANNEVQVPVPPLVFTQAARTSASVFISFTGIVAPVGSVLPGIAPVAIVVSLLTAANAFANPVTLVELVPTALIDVMNGASAHTLATVVSSFTLMNVVGPKLPQGPNAAISARFAFVPDPLLPPVAVRYTCELELGQM